MGRGRQIHVTGHRAALRRVSDVRQNCRIFTLTNDFSSSLCVKTGSGAYPASCKMGTGGPFPRAKARPGRDADHSTPSSAEVVNE
jgi:hypothetical protein